MITEEEFKIRLIEDIKNAKKQYLRSQNRSSFFGIRRRTNTGKEVAGLRQKDCYFTLIEGDKWLGEKEYINIVGLRSFVEREKFINDNQLKLWIKNNSKQFPILNDLIDRVPDAIDELRVHGSMCVALMYKQRKYIDTRMEEITRELP